MNSDRMQQNEWINQRDNSDINSDEYKRAENYIRDIQFDTINKQTAGLQDFLSEYKKQSDKTNNFLLYLTIATVILGLLGVMFQMISLGNSDSKIDIVQVID